MILWLTAAFVVFIVYLGYRVRLLEDKIETMWLFMVRRGVAEAFNKNVIVDISQPNFKSSDRRDVGREEHAEPASPRH